MKNIITFFTHKEQRGIKAFTLVETLVSITILTIAISGPLSVALFASSHAKDTKNKMIATWLAEESIEVLRNKRDTIFLACLNSQPLCTNFNISLGLPENTQESSWKNFKTINISIFSAILPPNIKFDCYTGCAYDAQGAPLNLTAGRCLTLTTNNLFQKGMQNGIGGSHQIAKDGMYVCNLYANRTGNIGGGDIDSDFTRYLTVESLSPISDETYDQTYKDTFRVRSYVNYKTPGGEVKTIMVEDFLNSRI